MKTVIRLGLVLAAALVVSNLPELARQFGPES